MVVVRLSEQTRRRHGPVSWIHRLAERVTTTSFSLTSRAHGSVPDYYQVDLLWSVLVVCWL